MLRLAAPVLAALVLVTSLPAQIESLPPPVLNANSFELLSNSRYSVHSGFTSNLPRQVLANVLWAMNRVPGLGTYRELYVATPENVYRYDSLAHALIVHRAGDYRYNSGSAFEVGIACARNEEAGYAVQAGLLAGIAFWDSSSASVVCCPMQFATNHANSNWNPVHPIMMVNVYGRANATGLVARLQAISTDSTLPDPRVVGPDTFEVLLASLHLDSLFAPDPLPIVAISQILWAGYGVTPHMAIGKRGTTIPSAVANYYLTRRIYLVRDTAVQRYHNRIPPGNGMSTSDHRLELVTAGDRRELLRAACSRIPSTAPLYVVVTVADTGLNWSLMEAGFAGFQYAMQAAQLGLNCFITAPLAPDERSAIIAALGLPTADLPVLVFACGSPVTAFKEASEPGRPGLSLQIASSRSGVLFSGSLANSRRGQLQITDLTGRIRQVFDLLADHSGKFRLDWAGTDHSGHRLGPGLYVCRLVTAQGSIRARLTLTR
ncbi:MAG: hypothetical protein ABIK62_03225 [candidate division WOR-3 bacterium]